MLDGFPKHESDPIKPQKALDLNGYQGKDLRGIAAVKKRKLVRAMNARSQKVDLYCFKQLRVLLE